MLDILTVIRQTASPMERNHDHKPGDRVVTFWVDAATIARADRAATLLGVKRSEFYRQAGERLADAVLAGTESADVIARLVASNQQGGPTNGTVC